MIIEKIIDDHCRGEPLLAVQMFNGFPGTPLTELQGIHMEQHRAVVLWVLIEMEMRRLE